MPRRRLWRSRGRHGQAVDATAFSWVRESRLAGELDRRLLCSLRHWFEEAWNFSGYVFVTNEQFEQQVAMIEATDLQLRFEITLPDHPGRYLAYA